MFANTIMELRYSHTKSDGTLETWDDIARRVTNAVLSVVNVTDDVKSGIERIIRERKFIPGGRFLAQAGRPFHQTSNCFLLRAEDTREGWGDLANKSMTMLMSGGGIGVDYSDIRASGALLKRTGGTSSGPLPLARTINEIGRGVMSGGKRRSAIYGSLRWSHGDTLDFIKAKNWPEYIRREKESNFDAPAPLDMTNISVILDKEFFTAFDNSGHSQHGHAQEVYWRVIENMVKTGEPGFQVDYNNPRESLRNAPVHPDTFILTNRGYERVGDIVGEEIVVWTGKQWANTIFKKTKENSPVVKVKLSGGREIICSPEHEFILDNEQRYPAEQLELNDSLLIKFRPEPNGYVYKHEWNEERRLYYTLGYIYGDGSFNRKYPRADITFCTPESKKCVENIYTDVSITDPDNRGFTRVYTKNNELFRNRNKSVFPHDLYSEPVVKQVSFLAGLFDADGNYFHGQHRIRLSSIHREFLVGVRRLLESLGILSSINRGGISTYGQKEGWMLVVNTEYNNRFVDMIPTVRIKPQKYDAYRKTKIRVVSVEDAGYSDVFCCDVGVPEHSFMAEGVIISNCTEIVSEDDSDVCVLGSINLSKIKNIEELKTVTELGTIFLMAGTEYTDVPTDRVREVQVKNRRIGNGLMGLSEWLIVRDYPYGPNLELAKWLQVWQDESNSTANYYSKLWSWNKPVAVRAIAPNGSISIAGGQTTSGIEPIFAVAFQRRYLTPDGWRKQYVIDPTAERLIEGGVGPDKIEDAYTLAFDVERRIAFQVFIQGFVDNSISSTINMPPFGKAGNDDHKAFGLKLYKYLPHLRGITTYPDGARGGQPLEVVDYDFALRHKNKVFESNEDCVGGVCGL